MQIRAAVLTVSDRCARGEQRDESGALLKELLEAFGAEVVVTEIIADDLEPLTAKLRALTDLPGLDLIITTGGTGFAPRDNTPEATRAVIEREAPGLAEAMRAVTLRETPTAMLSRGVCGMRGRTLIVNLPGSPSGVRSCFAVISPVLPHALMLLAGGTSGHAR